MLKATRAYSRIFIAGNNHYHGIRSIEENGALAHANKLARVLLRDKKVATEEKALSLANFEVQRLRWNLEGFQGNRIAQEELSRKRKQRERQAASVLLGGLRVVATNSRSPS